MCVRGGKTVISPAVRETPPTSSINIVDKTIVNVVISGALFVKLACINKHIYVYFTAGRCVKMAVRRHDRTY